MSVGFAVLFWFGTCICTIGVGITAFIVTFWRAKSLWGLTKTLELPIIEKKKKNSEHSSE